MLDSKLSKHLLVPGAALLALLVGCNQNDRVSDDRPASGPAPSSSPQQPAQPVTVVDQAGVPSPGEAYDQVSGDINDENVDAELQRLMDEIEAAEDN